MVWHAILGASVGFFLTMISVALSVFGQERGFWSIIQVFNGKYEGSLVVIVMAMAVGAGGGVAFAKIISK